MTVTSMASRSKSFSSRALTPTFGFSKSGLPVDQSGDFGIGAATAVGTEMVFDGAAAPSIGRDFLDCSGQTKLRRRVIRPQRTTLRTERAGTARHAGWRLAHFKLRVAAMAASRDGHDLNPFCPAKPDKLAVPKVVERCCQHGVSSGFPSLMVRRRPCAVSNHQGNVRNPILRDAAKTPLPGMRDSRFAETPSP